MKIDLTLEQYLDSLPDAAAKRFFAERLGTSYDYLKHLAKGRRNITEGMAIAIERESAGAVLCETTCPGADWEYIRETKKSAA